MSLEHTGGLGAELVLEAAGTPSSLRMAVDSARKGGKIVVLGVFHEEVALDYRQILMAEKQIMGSIIYQREDFAEAIDIIGTGGIDQTHHITSEVPLRDIVSRGFLPLSESKAEHIKIRDRLTNPNLRFTLFTDCLLPFNAANRLLLCDLRGLMALDIS